MNQEKVWDAIADQWHNFRQQQFKPVYDFIERYQPKKGKILEIGCGNCRNLIPFAKNGFECHGLDFSKNMLAQAKKMMQKHKANIELKKANITNLPYKSNQFDYILHIASLHHLKEEESIESSLREASRILKPEGIMLLTVWNKLQLKFITRPKELHIPWKKNNREYKRFFHLFDYFELRRLLKNVNFQILESNILGKNLIFVLKKI